MIENYENLPKVLSVKDLAISFKTDKGLVHAVRGVSFDLYKGETLCIVGESGSGKSVTNKAIMGISAKNAIIESGSIMYEGEDLLRVSEEEFHRIRGHKIGMIFQDPLSALNPVVRIGKQITEATLINKNILKRKYRELISSELIALRNEQANTNFEIDKSIKEIENCKVLIKKLKKKNTKKLPNIEETSNEEVLKYFENLRISLRHTIERTNEVISKIDETKKEDLSELKVKILSLRKEGLVLVIGLLKTHKEEILDESKDYISRLQNRILFLKTYIKVLKESLKKVSPSLKEDLSLSKKSAKLYINNYHNELKTKLEKDLNENELKLTEAKEEITSLYNSLSKEEQDSILEILNHNDLARKKLHKLANKNREVNVSKTAKDESLEILKTDNEKFNELYDLVVSLKKNKNKINEDFINSTKVTRAEAKRQALEVMREVGIPLPERRYRQYPFEFSGGMRQRIVIAIALTANPDILICDEPTTALDVTIQAQILELINRLKRERHLSCIFITHDLGVVANMADRVAVMYAGKIVEYGTAKDIFFDPKHPYTWALLSSIPDIDSKEKLEAIPGTPPDMRFPPKGDAFALRSKYAMEIDFEAHPPFFKVSDTHYAATWLLYPGAPKVEMPTIVKTRIENAMKLHHMKEEIKDEEKPTRRKTSEV